MTEPFKWNPQKNELLKARHGVGFEDVIIAFQEERLLADMPHPSKAYPHQHLAVVLIDDYAYAVPYVVKAESRFLKTLFPSRKLNKQLNPESKNDQP